MGSRHCVLVLGATDEGLTASARGSRRFEGRRGFPRGGKQSPGFCPCSCGHLEHLGGVLEHLRCAEFLISAGKAAKSHPKSPPPAALAALRERWSSGRDCQHQDPKSVTQQSFASTSQNPELRGVESSSILCIPPEVSQGNLTAEQALPELPKSLAGVIVLDPGPAGLSRGPLWACGVN